MPIIVSSKFVSTLAMDYLVVFLYIEQDYQISKCCSICQNNQMKETKPKCKAANPHIQSLAKKLCIQQTMNYYMSLLQEHRQFIQDLYINNDGVFDDEFVAFLQELRQPLKGYRYQVFKNADIKMEIIIKKTIKDVNQGSMYDLTQFYESVFERNKQLSKTYTFLDKKNLIVFLTMSHLICFDIFACIFHQNKEFRQNCCEQIQIFPKSFLLIFIPVINPYTISKMYDFYQNVKQYVSFPKIWKNLIGVWTLMKIKSRFQLIKKKNSRQHIEYLQRRQKRYKMKNSTLNKAAQNIFIKYNFSQILIFSLLKLNKLFPIKDKTAILTKIKQMSIEDEQVLRKSKVLLLQMKYQINFNTINSFFDSLTRKLGKQNQYFYEKKSLAALEDILMYAFSICESYKELINVLKLQSNYSIEINKANGNLAGDLQAIACFPVAEVMQIRSYLLITYLNLKIERMLGRSFLVFKKLEFSFSHLQHQRKLKKSKGPKITVVVGTYKESPVFYQITRGKLTNEKYIHCIENYLKKSDIKQPFALVLADLEKENSLTWQHINTIFNFVWKHYNSRAYYTSATGVCKLTIVLYLHLQKVLRVFRKQITQQNFEQITQTLIKRQLKNFIQHF